MLNSFSESYKEAGVDITAGYRSVELIKKHVERTRINGVIEEIGGFGGLFALPKNIGNDPVLVSGTDGVGTKLKIAMLSDRHDTIGIDAVAMCVNDIICSAAKPLFFLDYIALGKNKPEKVEQIVKGIAEGCVLAGCALVGGETAEHPSLMGIDEYDLAGFCVGITDKSKIPDKNNVKNKDVIIGLSSSGVHSNGFSLTRKIFNIDNEPGILNRHFDEIGKTLRDELLIPTKIYVNSILGLFEKGIIKSACHITGGGFFENIPRILGDNLGAVIYKELLEIPPIFELIAKTGNISYKDMYNTYNMGIGMCLISSPENTDEVISYLNSNGEKAMVIGEVKSTISGVVIEL